MSYKEIHEDLGAFSFLVYIIHFMLSEILPQRASWHKQIMNWNCLYSEKNILQWLGWISQETPDTNSQ